MSAFGSESTDYHHRLNVRNQYKPVIRDGKLAWHPSQFIANDSFAAKAVIDILAIIKSTFCNQVRSKRLTTILFL